MANNASCRLITPVCRLSFPAVIEAKPVMGDQDKKRFGAELIFAPEDLVKFKLQDDKGRLTMVDIRTVCAAVAREQWGENFDVQAKKKIKTSEGGLGWPLKDGNVYAARREEEGKSGDVYRGMVYVRTKGSEDYPPILKYLSEDKRFIELSRRTDADVCRDYFTPGNYVIASLNCTAVETPAKEKFVTLYLNEVCFIKRGERLGGGGSLLDENLEGVFGGIDDFDPREGLDESIAL